MAKQRNIDLGDEDYEQEDSKGGGKSSKNESIERFLNMKYEFFFNVIKQKPEYKPTNSKVSFVPVSKYVLNTLKRELDGFGVATSTSNIQQIIESTFSPPINPIKQYFLDLPLWDGKDYIKELADTVQVKNSKHWHEYLKKWMIAVIANALIDEKCANHCCLVLTGEQGKFKTTWLENLCPKKLTYYLFTGKIDPTNKDTLTYLAEFLFVNIDDQLRQLNKKDENELKNLITINSVKYRRPYDPYITEYPHTASFMASVNGNDFLTDPTGSRRFLPFEVLDINIKEAQQLNLDNCWKQAYHFYKEKYRYWFIDEEIEELHQNNSMFAVTSQEEELLTEYFKPAALRSEATHFYTSSLIKTKLEEYTKQKLNSKKLGEALVKLNFQKWQKTDEGIKSWVWSVIEKDGIDIKEQNRNKRLVEETNSELEF